MVVPDDVNGIKRAVKPNDVAEAAGVDVADVGVAHVRVVAHADADRSANDERIDQHRRRLPGHGAQRVPD